jgi:inner membrane protein
MDNVTHALAGLLMADVALQAMGARSGRPVSPRVRRATVLLGVVAAEFPDSDLVYSGPLVRMGPLGYLLHHRGHTHTLVWATLGAVALWLVARWWVRRGDGDGAHAADGVTPPLWLAVAGTWSHLLLDWTNSYGVHPFWPFDNRWWYGDAVFIVEPWLWLVAIPPLLFAPRSRGGRVVLGALALLILAASVWTGEVARDVTVALAAFTAVWMSAQWVVPPRARAWGGVAMWGVVTVAFVAGRTVVRGTVTRTAAASGAAVLDVVLNPAPGDPTCWTALVATRSADGGAYRVTSAAAAVLAGRDAARCRQAAPRGRAGGDVLSGLAGASLDPPFASTPQVAWRSTWQAPVAALAALAAKRCEVAAALRFMRTPVWQQGPDGALLLVDARYGMGGGFNTLRLPPPTGGCGLAGRWVPPWREPRRDLLQGTGATPPSRAPG